MRVVVVGDIRLFCEGLAYYLRRTPDVTVVGIARSSGDSLALCRRLAPDVALVDMAMAESMDAVRSLHEAVPSTRVVGISVPDEGGAVIACAEAGISAYVAREGSLEDLATTLRSVMRDEASISPRIAAALLRRLADGARTGNGPAPAAHGVLTQREVEIADLVREGLSNKQIARRLRIRLPTVKNHVHNILEKLNVHRRAEVAGRLGHASASLNSSPHWLRGSGSNDESCVDPQDHISERSGDAGSR